MYYIKNNFGLVISDLGLKYIWEKLWKRKTIFLLSSYIFKMVLSYFFLMYQKYLLLFWTINIMSVIFLPNIYNKIYLESIYWAWFPSCNQIQNSYNYVRNFFYLQLFNPEYSLLWFIPLSPCCLFISRDSLSHLSCIIFLFSKWISLQKLFLFFVEFIIFNI